MIVTQLCCFVAMRQMTVDKHNAWNSNIKRDTHTSLVAAHATERSGLLFRLYVAYQGTQSFAGKHDQVRCLQSDRSDHEKSITKTLLNNLCQLFLWWSHNWCSDWTKSFLRSNCIYIMMNLLWSEHIIDIFEGWLLASHIPCNCK